MAADFTLYTNPLTKALHCMPREDKSHTQDKEKTAKSTAGKRQESMQAHVDKVMEEVQESHSADIIASDMTMYDSPLSALERETRTREMKERDGEHGEHHVRHRRHAGHSHGHSHSHGHKKGTAPANGLVAGPVKPKFKD